MLVQSKFKTNKIANMGIKIHKVKDNGVTPHGGFGMELLYPGEFFKNFHKNQQEIASCMQIVMGLNFSEYFCSIISKIF